LTEPVATRIWDLPTRLFHWTLAALVIAAIVTAKVGGEWMAWHLRCGEAVLALLAFRWAWGLVGGHWSRFATFLPTPTRLARGLRGRASADDAIGHNALGSLSVWAFLLLLTAQVATGLVADDDIDTTGPLNSPCRRALREARERLARRLGRRPDHGADRAARGGHRLVHVLRRHEPLLRAMWSGDKALPFGTRASRDGAATRLLALAILALAAAAVWAMVRWAG
jgi:cytochrome b